MFENNSQSVFACRCCDDSGPHADSTQPSALERSEYASFSGRWQRVIFVAGGNNPICSHEAPEATHLYHHSQRVRTSHYILRALS